MVVDNEEEPVEGVPLEQYRAWLGEKDLEVGKLGFSLYLVKGRGFVLRKVKILYDGDLSLPLGLALGSPIFPSGCEGKLGVALESLQGLRDLT